MSTESEWSKGFTQGYAAAVANLLRDHDATTEACDCYRANFHSVKQLRDLGTPEDDIEILKPIIKEIKRNKK